MSIVLELKRRNVFRVAFAYVIIAWLILQIGDTLGPALRLPEAVNTALAFFLILGFPLAVFFAWAFELTPEGIKKEKDVDRSQSITHVTGRKLDYIIIAVLVLALGYFAFDKFVLDPSRDAELVQTTTKAVTEQVSESAISEIPDNSIAVLAFTDLSPEGDQEYFSDGISEELLNVLAKIPGLRVAARTSSFQFKGENRDAVDIGQQLNVALVLEGSVRKAGVQIRITAQLIDASTGFHLWSDTYDRELANIFAVQDEISAAIVGALKEHLGLQVEAAVQRRYTDNPDAYDAYLQGWALIKSFNPGVDGSTKLDGARQHFERALAFDSAYALAFVGLAFVEAYYDWIGEGTLDTLTRAEQHARRALAVDPGLSEAHAVLGDIHGGRDEWAAAIAAYHEAIRLDPQNAYAWEELAWALNSKDPPEPVEAEQAAREAIRLKPTYLYNYYQLGWALETQGRCDEAIAAFEQALRINPAFLDGSHGLAHVYLAQGEYGKALARFEVEREIQESPMLISDIAAAYAGLGDSEKALAALEDALASGYRDFAMIDTSSHFASLRSDARFQALLDKYRN